MLEPMFNVKIAFFFRASIYSLFYKMWAYFEGMKKIRVTFYHFVAF